MSEDFEAMKRRLRDQGLITAAGRLTDQGKEYTDQLIIELRRATAAGNSGGKRIKWRWKYQGAK